MNPQKTLLLVGGTDETVIKAKELGLHVLLLQHPTKVTAAQERLADVIRVVDYTDWDLAEPIVLELQESPGFGAALSLTEPGLEAAARINDMFDLGGTGYEVTRRIRDKWAMRLHLASSGPGGGRRRAAARPRGPGGLRRPVSATRSSSSRPMPPRASACSGSAVPRTSSGCGPKVRRLRGTRTDRISTLFVLQDFLMEEYIDGAEYSVESFSFAGRHVVITITEKFTEAGHFAELGHAVPARLDEHVCEHVRACVSRFLDLMGVRDGLGHTEVRISARGPSGHRGPHPLRRRRHP